MDCKGFQAVIHDLWRESLDVAARREGLDHAAGCPVCRRRFAEERSLNIGLRLVAAESAPAKAPASVEASLLEAFESQKGRNPRIGGIGLIGLARAHRQIGRWALAVAALALLAAVPLGVRHWRTRAPGAGAPRTQSSEAPPRPAAETPQRAGPLSVAPESPASGLPRPRTRPRARSMATYDAVRSFVPLPGTAYPPDEESVEVVRVSLPLSALVDLGVPVDEDAGETTVQAQVLIGDDGTAQAIRFLR